MNEIEKILKDVFHLGYLMPSQETVITRILENSTLSDPRDSITILPTGAGKSLCFMLPAVAFERKYSILIYPLLSLMNDQALRFEKLSVPYSLIKGGMSREEKSAELFRLRTFKSKILITNIESLKILVERKALDFMMGKIELFVIDEAHTAVQWAESFRPVFLELNALSEYLKPHQRLCFTATADDEIIRKLLENVLKNRNAEILRISSDRGNIYYKAIRTLNREKDIYACIKDPNRRPVLVFCSYRNETEEYYELFKEKFPTFFYHAGLLKEEKIRIEKEYLKSSDGLLFATNAYGMGVDKKNIRTVIHLHAPDDASSFLQEAGRGGRDNKDMLSLVLYSENDKGSLKYIFEGNVCIRHSLLSLMGERSDSACSSCSKCQKDDESAEGEKIILKKIKRIPFLYSIKSATRILSITALRDWKSYQIKRAIETLIKEKKIKQLFGRLY